MTGQELAYLMRYVFALFVVLAAAMLLRTSLRDLSLRAREYFRPVQGHFLMVMAGKDQDAVPVKSLPLFHTTTLGSGRSCDIRLGSEKTRRREAVIYLYDNQWFIYPHDEKSQVSINGVQIQAAIPLEDHDLLTLGDVNLLYLADSPMPDAELRLNQDDPGMVKTGGAFVFTNLYILAGTLLMAYRMEGALEPLMEHVFILFAIFFAAFNLYYLILPYVLRPLDRPLYLAVMNLSFTGLLIQTRLSALWPRSQPPDAEVLERITRDIDTQSFALYLGLLLIPIIALLVLRTTLLEKLVPVCAVLTPLLLIITLIFGHGRETNGAQLWLSIGPLSVQPTEYVKITYLIVLAGFFKIRPPRRTQLIFAGWAAVCIFLIMLLPDLGSVMILLPVTIIVYAVMTSEYLTTFFILLAGTGVGTLAIALFPHVRRRLEGWTTLWSEVNDSNAQIVYGLQAIGRGGLLGRGVGNGSPESVYRAVDDMVFAVLGEEMGILVSLAIIVFYLVIWLRGLKGVVVVRDGFTSGLTLGVSTALLVEALVVIGGTTGLIPLTGATLPFIASGGSSLLAKLIMAGLLLGLVGRRDNLNYNRRIPLPQAMDSQSPLPRTLPDGSQLPDLTRRPQSGKPAQDPAYTPGRARGGQAPGNGGHAPGNGGQAPGSGGHAPGNGGHG